MKKLQNRNIVPQPLAGKRLPDDWMRNAQAVGAKADEDYKNKTENAWRQPMSTRSNNDDGNLMRSARLSQ